MIIEFPGAVSVRELPDELAPFVAMLQNEDADVVTGLAVSFWVRPRSKATKEDCRHFIELPDSIPVACLAAHLVRLMQTLQTSGIECVEHIELALQAWRGTERAQVWSEDGYIHRMFFDTVLEGGEPTRKRRRRPGVTVRYRPHDKEVNLLAVMFGHDD